MSVDWTGKLETVEGKAVNLKRVKPEGGAEVFIDGDPSSRSYLDDGRHFFGSCPDIRNARTDPANYIMREVINLGVYSVDDIERATHLLAITATHSGAKSDAVIQGRSVMVRSELAINSMLAYAAERVSEVAAQGPRTADDLSEVINAWLAKDCDWGNWERDLNAVCNRECLTTTRSGNTTQNKAGFRALAVLDWLVDNQPDCFGWHPPFPSTTPSIKIEADALRHALATTPTRNTSQIGEG